MVIEQPIWHIPKLRWQYGITRDQSGIGRRADWIFFVSGYLRDRWIQARMGTTLSDEFNPEEGVPTSGVLAVICFGLQINELPSLIATVIFRAICGWLGDMFSCTPPGHHRYIYGRQQIPYKNVQQRMASDLQTISVKSYISLHPNPSFWAPCDQAWWHTLVNRGVNKVTWAVVGLAPLLQEAQKCSQSALDGALSIFRLVAHFKWGGSGNILVMLYRPVFAPIQTMVALCIAQRRIPTCDNFDSMHSMVLTLALEATWNALHQFLVCTRGPKRLLWKNVDKSCPYIAISKLVPTLTIWHIKLCMNLTTPPGIYMS